MEGRLAAARFRKLRAIMVLIWIGGLAVLLWMSPVAGDDAYAHSVMAVEQLKCWRHGVLWPRFHPDWNGGTGSFLPSVYAPLTLTAEGAACWLTGEGSRAVGVVLVGGLLAGAVLLWASLRSRGIDGGFGWVVAAYPVAAVLARATTTEVMALAFAGPVLVLGLPPGPRTRYQGVALALAVALASGCQVGMVLMTGLVLVAAWLVSRYAWKRQSLGTAAWFGSGVLVGGILWWPTIHDFAWMAKEALLHGEYDWRSHHVLAVSGNAELGPVLLACCVSLLAAAIMICVSARNREERWPVVAGVGWALALATPLSFPLWRTAHLMAGLQFPWRFLGPATILCLAGAAISERTTRRIVLALLVVPVLLTPVELATPRPELSPTLDGMELARRSSIRYGIAAVLPSMPGFYAPGFNAIESLRKLTGQRARVVSLEGGFPFPRTFEVSAPAGTEVLLPLQWWPELQLQVEGRRVAFANRFGLVAVELERPSERLTFSLLPSGSRRIGAAVSLVGLLLLGMLWVVWGRRWDEAHVRAPRRGQSETAREP